MKAYHGAWKYGCASLIGVLLAGVSPAALAAPSKDPREARIEQLEAEMQQLLQDNQRLHAEDEAIRQRSEQLQAEVEALKQGQATQSQALQTQGQAIQTVEAKAPAPPSVIDNMINGRPVFTSANGRFTLTLHSVMQLDAG